MPSLSNAFRGELIQVLNKHSVDNTCNMPDFILAELVAAQLEALAAANQQHARWRGYQ